MAELSFTFLLHLSSLGSPSSVSTSWVFRCNHHPSSISVMNCLLASFTCQTSAHYAPKWTTYFLLLFHFSIFSNLKARGITFDFSFCLFFYNKFIILPSEVSFSFVPYFLRSDHLFSSSPPFFSSTAKLQLSLAWSLFSLNHLAHGSWFIISKTITLILFWAQKHSMANI